MTPLQRVGRQGLYDPRFEHDACGIGMLVNIKGMKSHALISDAITVLHRLKHRGGSGSNSDTGDGAGLLMQIPHEFFSAVGSSERIFLPPAGEYGVAMLFASPEPDRCAETLKAFASLASGEGLEVLWSRRVPTNQAAAGKSARDVCPSIYQVFIQKSSEHKSAEEFDRSLYILSRIAGKAIRSAASHADPYFYVLSCSSKTIVYKGMLLPSQLASFYLDLLDQRLKSAVVLVHSRFSTNTFPSWERAHPQHILIHNGEINTIRGNVNWTKSREARLSSPLFGDDLRRILPLIDEDGSDSAMLDDYIRFLLHAGYSLPHAMSLAIPEPYEQNEHMSAERRAYYEFHNCISEPWDGPAALAFTDGDVCGALLDRNGLRPARYTVSSDGILALSSEAGVIDLPPERVVVQGRVCPGQMLLVDMREGRIIEDDELKLRLAQMKPYKAWVERGLKNLDDLEQQDSVQDTSSLYEELQQSSDASFALAQKFRGLLDGIFCAVRDTRLSTNQRGRLFGYTWEDMTLTLKGMAETEDDPIGSMGTDIPLAVLSTRPQPLYNYFKQQFAQVTNPPIDSLREKNVMSSSILIGSEKNLLDPQESSCHFIKHPTPVLLPAEFAAITLLNSPDFRSLRLPMLFEARVSGMEDALQKIFCAADRALEQGYTILVLSDEDAGTAFAPLPALLAVSGLHQHLVRAGTRTSCSLVVAAGDAWETHHLAALIGFGADAVHPHLAFTLLDEMTTAGLLKLDRSTAWDHYTKAATKGIIKIMSKMGISSVRSYHGAQVFECLGLGKEVIDRYFTGTISRIGGLSLSHIEAEVLKRHGEALLFSAEEPLSAGGNYRWRNQEEYHLFNPESIYYLQQSCRGNDYELFKQYSESIDRRSEHLKNIRSLLDLRLAEKPLPLDMVEDEDSILRRFKTGAMSYGSISTEAHECLAIAMNRLGAKSNTGEGGEESRRFSRDENGDNRCSAIKQVASARFGVTIRYLSTATEIQIKIAQGAKPGEGGHLPGPKVYPWIAANRYATPGVELISPPPHHDIYSIEDLAQLIHDLKSANPAARISVKLVSEAGVGTIAVGVAKGLADVITISGYDGGTGAAPRTSIRHAGLPWELGIAETHQSLLLNGLRNRVTLETDGKLLTGRDVVIAALLGAEEFGFATAPLIAMGCDMMRVCNLDTCPVGIATQNETLRKNFSGKPEYVENLMRFIAREVREWMSRIGVRSFNDLIGHTEFLRQHRIEANTKSCTVDLSALLYQPKVSDTAQERYFSQPQRHALERCLDQAVLLPLCLPAVQNRSPVTHELSITNQDRTVGCGLSGAIAQMIGEERLPEGMISLRFTGAAGQSFGAFIQQGLCLSLVGEANDYLGKGLSGGTIIVRTPEPLQQSGKDVIAVGNVCFFGATEGEGYINGRAGERFCVRNSGARVVVEGVGDHGCEYMTGGVVVVLGSIGKNFAAGMSGGIAYLYDPDKRARTFCNLQKAGLHELTEDDRGAVKQLLAHHVRHTLSPRAQRILAHFDEEIGSFRKLVPSDYQKVMDALGDERRIDLSKEEKMLVAYQAVVA